MKRTLIAVALLAVVAACGPKLPPNTSVEGKTAVRGTQVVSALRAAISEIKKLVCTPQSPQTSVPSCLAPADADRVFSLMEKAGGTAEQLATALAAVDAAGNASQRETGLKQAGEYVRSLQNTLSLVQVSPSNEPARQSLVQLLGSVTGLLFAIAGF